MSFIDDLMEETKVELKQLARNSTCRELEDTILDVATGISTRNLKKVLVPIDSLFSRKADKADDDEYDDLVERYAVVAAKALAYQAITQQQLQRSLDREDKNDYLTACEKYDGYVEEYQDKDRDRDRPSSRKESRRDRDRDDDRPRRKSRRDAEGSRDRHTNSFERDGEEKPDRTTRRSSRKEEPVIDDVVVEETLDENAVVTVSNYHLLPPVAKDIPIFFAGVEELRFNKDTNAVNVTILDGDFKVNYEKHRTDLYLSGNREVKNIAISVEVLEKKLAEAATNRIKAFVDEQAKAQTETDTEIPVKNTPITKSTILEGNFRIEGSALGYEEHVRAACLDLVTNPNAEDYVIGLSVIHDIVRLDEVDRTSSDYIEFMEGVANLAVETKFADIKSVLAAAARVFTSAQYDIIHRIYNAAVCNALSVAMKIGIKTDSIVRNWEDIENLIKSTYIEQPQIIAVIEMNLCAALPTFFEDVETLSLIRNYIFLPISANEFTISSPVRYGTINKSARPELYGVINKLLTTNVPPETFKAYTTLVTNDNASIPVFKNRNLVTDSGYYACKPI